MDANTFSKQFNEIFSQRFKSFHAKESNEDFESVCFADFTEGINGIMEILAKKNNFQLKREFLNLDFAFFQKGGYRIKIAVEHENNIKRRKHNFKKLINVNSSLKVLICYYKKNQDTNKIMAFYENKFGKYEQLNSEFLLLLGDCEMIENDEADGPSYYLTKIFSK